MPQAKHYRDFIGLVFNQHLVQPPPLSSVNEYVKQVRCAALPERMRRAINIALPGFAERFIFAKELNNLRAFLYKGIVPERGPSVLLNHNAARRFSGGDDLGRGCYYTIAVDASGDDNGTLLREMQAYGDISWSGSVQIVEDKQIQNLKEPERTFYGSLTEWGQSIGLVFLDLPHAPNRYFSMQEGQPDADFYRTYAENIRFCGVRIPYVIDKLKRADVFDLRQPEAQQWLVELLRFVGVSDPDMRTVPIENFFDTLTVITCPRLGGSVWTELVGAVLRSYGAAGMIFPSARGSSYLTYLSTQRQSSSGWVFVDYAGAERPPLDSPIEITSEWSLRSPQELLQSFTKLNGSPSSWTLMGLNRQWDDWMAKEYRDLLNETSDQRSRRMFDYYDYSRIIRFFEDDAFRSKMNKAMVACNLEGGVERISVRDWQYVLEFVNVKENIPHLDDITPCSLPMGISLIGYDRDARSYGAESLFC